MYARVENGSTAFVPQTFEEELDHFGGIIDSLPGLVTDKLLAATDRFGTWDSVVVGLNGHSGFPGYEDMEGVRYLLQNLEAADGKGFFVMGYNVDEADQMITGCTKALSLPSSAQEYVEGEREELLMMLGTQGVSELVRDLGIMQPVASYDGRLDDYLSASSAPETPTPKRRKEKPERITTWRRLEQIARGLHWTISSTTNHGLLIASDGTPFPYPRHSDFSAEMMNDLMKFIRIHSQ